MPIEIELKLRLAPEQLAKLKRHALIKSHQLTRPVTRRLYNIYFDTPRLDLQHSGMALRLRRSGVKWLQTLKGGGSVQGGLHQRNEWEMPVQGPALDFSVPQIAEWKDLLPRHLRKKLQPVFVTDFSRNSRIMSWQGAEIELCMDHGEISTEHLHTPICELELELKSGEPQQLLELALAILDVVPFELESISKAEQGYRLFLGNTEQAVKASQLMLEKHDKLSTVMQSLIWSVLQHLQRNVRGAMASEDAEYLHQMRVALRRLRVLLRVVENVCEDEKLSRFRAEFAELGVVLGKIREWDVFMAETLRAMHENLPADAGLQSLMTASDQQRDACYRLLNNDVQAREMQRLMLRFSIWMSSPYWQQFAQVELQARNFSSSCLTRLARRFERSAENLHDLDVVKLHAMRIQAKKLRYCADFFATLYGKQKFRIYMAALSKAQDRLGQIHDDAVAQHLLDELSAIPALTGHQDTIALTRGWIVHDLSGQFAMLDEAMRKFQGLQSFWEK